MKENDYNKINLSVAGKPLYLFAGEKRPENAFLTLTENYRKIVQKNKLCDSKEQ